MIITLSILKFKFVAATLFFPNTIPVKLESRKEDRKSFFDLSPLRDQ
jgi:hypothetical protein